MVSREKEREDESDRASESARESATESTGRSAVERYFERTEQSRALHEAAVAHMPGGSTREVLHYSPYPAYASRGEGPYLTDVDGNQYLDFLNNYTSLIHGHAPAEPVERAIEEARKGSAPGAPTPVEVEWAEHLAGRSRAVEWIRFTNSGTEATMNAVRAARAHTGKDVIAKIEGAYHGTHDDVMMSVHPPTHLAGPASDPKSVPDSAGVPASKREEVVALPWNDAEAALSKLERNRDDLAAVLVAPIMGSAVIPGDREFVERIDEFTTEHDVPLITDEVISFRLHYEGAHARYGIEPDLVAFGKIIGGGFPVGAFGGRTEIMRGYDPRGGADIVHSGTFNANPVTAAAGLAALEAYTESEVERINDLGARLARRSREVLADHGVAAQVNQVGSLFNVYLSPDPVEDYRDTTGLPTELERRLYFELLDEGVRLAPKLMGALSTPMGEDEVDRFPEVLSAALDRLRPTIEAEAPGLLVD